MTYRSPFDDLVNRRVEFNSLDEHYLRYDKTFDKLLSQTSEAVETEPAQQTLETELQRVLHPPRIIRAIIDYKIKRQSKVEYLLSDAIQIALQTYAGGNTAHLISQLETEIEKRDDSFLKVRVRQKEDLATWETYKPMFSQETAKSIAARTQKDLLFIALAHGGVAPGIDVYLRYCDLVNSQKSYFYPVRCSLEKSNDSTPQLSSKEKRMLREQVSGKDIVIFDEDSYSGSTLKMARDFFQNLLRRKKIIIAANYMTEMAKKNF